MMFLRPEALVLPAPHRLYSRIERGCAALHQVHLKPQQGRSAHEVKDVMHKGVDGSAPITPSPN